MQSFKFYKMHGLGNDFVLIFQEDFEIHLDKKQICSLADRHLGIGFDQLLLIKKVNSTLIFCQIFNSDGSEAEQCGNGLRCVARFVYDKNIVKQKNFSIETKAGIFPAEILTNNLIRITMSIPNFDDSQVPYFSNKLDFLNEDIYADVLQYTVLSVGNPHIILEIPSLINFPINFIGQSIGNNSAFPEGINTGFMQVISPSHARLRTFERGAGETLACGSNACAAGVAGILKRVLISPVEIELALGKILVEWNGENEPVIMTGPAEYIFEGIYTFIGDK